MAKKKKNPSTFKKLSWWSALFVGAILGIASQRIPEFKSYTDRIVRPIEKSELFKQIKSKIESYYHPSAVYSSDQDFPYSNYQQQKPLLGQPISSFIVNRSGYSLAYDARTRNPAWVYEHLTAETIKGDADRSHFSFKEDETIPKHLRATTADYKGQGLDQGHMAPAADHRSSPEAMSETFYLTNMCPQCPQFNREYWSKLERHVRDLTKEYQHVYVITGPLYLPYQEGKRRFVKYQVIGPNDVAVPSHFFKVITLEDQDGQREIRAYVLPNTTISSDTSLNHFRTSVEKVEKIAGLILFNRSGQSLN